MPVGRLDAAFSSDATVANPTTASYAVSAGSNRLLVVFVAAEGNPVGTISA